jgi:uncharacterized protein
MMSAMIATPTPPAEREPVLDVLRGFAVLGILLINVEYMRGSAFYAGLLGESLPAGPIDRAVQFATGWLALGKFLSSLAILFGIGAALIADRAVQTGSSPYRLLARRYGVMIGIGLAHMILLFPGDILVLYGLAGLVLLAFIDMPAPRALRWSAVLLGATTVVFIGFAALPAVAPAAPADDPFASGIKALISGQRDQAVAAYTDGSYPDVIGVHVVQAAIVQGGQLFLLAWVVGLFLVGLAVVRVGVVSDLAGNRWLLRRAAVVGIGIGLPANLILGDFGPLWMGGGVEADAAWLMVGTAAQVLGAPLLAVGYLSGIALLTLRFGGWRRLAATGRMALTAYLGQSVLALVVFAGFGLYDRMGSAQAMVVVAGIWALLLLACPAWLERFQYGPIEWLWRSVTYGRRQPHRAGR